MIDFQNWKSTVIVLMAAIALKTCTVYVHIQNNRQRQSVHSPTRVYAKSNISRVFANSTAPRVYSYCEYRNYRVLEWWKVWGVNGVCTSGLVSVGLCQCCLEHVSHSFVNYLLPPLHTDTHRESNRTRSGRNKGNSYILRAFVGLSYIS